MYPRNAASPPRIALGAVIQISDGAVQSSGVSVAVRPNGGAELAGGGAISYGGSSGIVYYTPTQGETDYTDFVVVAYKTGCIPVEKTIITTASTTSGTVKPADGSIVTATFGTCVPPAPSGMSTLTQTQVTGGAYPLSDASFAFNSALDLTTTQKASVTDAAGDVTGDTGITLEKALEMLAAFMAGKVSVSSSGGVSTYTYLKRDGATTSFTSLASETDGTRATTGSLS